MSDWYKWDKEQDTIEACDTYEACELLQSPGYKRVASDTVNGKLLSTVFLGLDHRLNDSEGTPLVFETMLFPEGSWQDLYCERYSTPQQAREGHARLLAQLKEGKPLGQEEKDE